MPIELPAISRRQFLAGSAATAAGAALAPRTLWAAPAKWRDPHTWALLSDPHIAHDRKEAKNGVVMYDHFTAVSREVTHLPQLPVGALIMGDCAVSKGKPKDYHTLIKLLEPLRTSGMPVHLTMGNHDDRKNFLEAAVDQVAMPLPVPSRIVRVIETDRANWFILDSLDKTNSTPGELGNAQLQWLARELDARRDKPALVAAHHNLRSVKNELAGKEDISLQDTDALLNVLAPRPQVKCYLHGHIHHWEIRQRAGIHIVSLPPVSWVFQPGDPSGWVHCALEPNGALLRISTLDHHHPANGQTVHLTWRA